MKPEKNRDQSVPIPDQSLLADELDNAWLEAYADLPRERAERLSKISHAAAKALRQIQGAREGEESPSSSGLHWRDISTAPKDGTRILLWCVHKNAQYSSNAVKDGYEAAVIGAWTKFNRGGWVWDGLAGTHSHWMPLPPPPGTPEKTPDNLLPSDQLRAQVEALTKERDEAIEWFDRERPQVGPGTLPIWFADSVARRSRELRTGPRATGTPAAGKHNATTSDQLREARERIEVLEKALKRIATQPLTIEMDREGDYEEGYEGIIWIAREALSHPKEQQPS